MYRNGPDESNGYYELNGVMSDIKHKSFGGVKFSSSSSRYKRKSFD